MNVVKQVRNHIKLSFIQCWSFKLSRAFLLQVEFTVRYTARGELTPSVVNITLADVPLEQLVLQTHSVQFKVHFYSEKYYF